MLLLVLLAVGISLAQLGVGLAVGIWLERSAARPDDAVQAVPASPLLEPVAAATASPQTATATAAAAPATTGTEAAADGQLRETLLVLREFAEGMQSFVEQHSDRMGTVNDRLRGMATTDAAPLAGDLRELMAEMMSANDQLRHELRSAHTQLQATQQELDSRTREARTDALTGLSNRRDFDLQLARRISEWSRRGTPVSLLLADVDHFKKFNDTHGHLAGDQVLRGVAGVLQSTMRDMDIVARYGGEEFAVIMPSTVIHEGQRAVVRALASIRGGRFPFEDKTLQVTASLGLAQAQPDESPADLIRRADECLYASKAAGRNCAHYHDGQMPLPVREDAPGPGCEPGERRKASRRRFEQRQLVAPYDGGELPPRPAFESVLCQDVSSDGFSYLADSEPRSREVVAWLGVEPNVRTMLAEVIYVLPLGDNHQPPYHVGCRFTSRVVGRGRFLSEPALAEV